MTLPLVPSQRNRTWWTVLATAVAFLAFLVCAIAPLYLYGLAQGLGPDDEVPEAGIWFVIAGCAIGAGAAFLVFRLVLIRYGRISAGDVDSMWRH
jgi:hypothetical protein